MTRDQSSTSQQSWRQNLAQGGASVAKRNPGLAIPFNNSARFSGRKNLSPAKAGSGILFATVPRAALRSTSFRYAGPGLNSAAGCAGSLSAGPFACGGTMRSKQKRQGLGLEMRTFKGNAGQNYLVFRTAGGSYHVFLEVDAKEAAEHCGVPRDGNTRQMWKDLWNNAKFITI